MARYLIEGLERQETRMFETGTISIPLESNKGKKRYQQHQYQTRDTGRFEHHQWFYRWDVSDNDELIVTISEYISPRQWYIRDNNNIARIPIVKFTGTGGMWSFTSRYDVVSGVGIVRSNGENILWWLDVARRFGGKKRGRDISNAYATDNWNELNSLNNLYNRYFTGNRIEDARNNIIYRKTLVSNIFINKVLSHSANEAKFLVSDGRVLTVRNIAPAGSYNYVTEIGPAPEDEIHGTKRIAKPRIAEPNKLIMALDITNLYDIYNILRNEYLNTKSVENNPVVTPNPNNMPSNNPNHQTVQDHVRKYRFDTTGIDQITMDQQININSIISASEQIQLYRKAKAAFTDMSGSEAKVNDKVYAHYQRSMSTYIASINRYIHQKSYVWDLSTDRCQMSCQVSCQLSCQIACQQCNSSTCHDQHCGTW